MLERTTEYLLLSTLIAECESRRRLLLEEDTVEEEIPSFPSWTHGQTRG